jgi:hypothetical protein
VVVVMAVVVAAAVVVVVVMGGGWPSFVGDGTVRPTKALLNHTI